MLPQRFEQALHAMFSETECIERRAFTVLHKIVLGLLPNDLEQQLLGSTASINVRDVSGRTALSLVVVRGNVHAVKTLLRYGADTSIASNSREAPLHSAASTVEPECLHDLVAASADVNALTN